MTTIREHLEAIRDDNGDDDDFAYMQAIAALNLLDGADRLINCTESEDFSRFDGSERLVADPEPTT